MYNLELKAMELVAEESTILRLVFDRFALTLSAESERYLVEVEDNHGKLINTVTVLYESLPDYDFRRGRYCEGVSFRSDHIGEFVLALSDMQLEVYSDMVRIYPRHGDAYICHMSLKIMED